MWLESKLFQSHNNNYYHHDNYDYHDKPKQ